MRALSPAMAAKLESAALQFCHIFKITRKDGVIMGFTDHDQPLTMDGVVYAPQTGFTATEAVQTHGLETDGLEIYGALSSSEITDEAVLAGTYDGAKVEISLVDWSDISIRHRLRVGEIGEIKIADRRFDAEVRGVGHKLDMPYGRLFQRACGARLGDGACGVDLTKASFKGAGTIVQIFSQDHFTVSGIDAFAPAWFDAGVLKLSAGANSGKLREIARHFKIGNLVHIQIWQPFGLRLVAGDAFSITAGCNKSVEQCQEKFANIANFRGFPHIPGTDFALAIARQGNQNDGGSRQ